MLYELLALQLPFPGKSLIEISRKISQAPSCSKHCFALLLTTDCLLLTHLLLTHDPLRHRPLIVYTRWRLTTYNLLPGYYIPLMESTYYLLPGSLRPAAAARGQRDGGAGAGGANPTQP